MCKAAVSTRSRAISLLFFKENAPDESQCEHEYRREDKEIGVNAVLSVSLLRQKVYLYHQTPSFLLVDRESATGMKNSWWASVPTMPLPSR